MMMMCRPDEGKGRGRVLKGVEAKIHTTIDIPHWPWHSTASFVIVYPER